ncbi:DUF2147 domain-containing protein [Acetobacter nitrogenifigens]|uniref:DUF2147 domain-containing protein n=1 Tax=Acetobacter nitrogenifigens TaxID=285268 RepID=UPI0006844735|nr:DUF2147 domain-containing protein [Acetobacter nitrogenifigens]
MRASHSKASRGLHALTADNFRRATFALFALAAADVSSASAQQEVANATPTAAPLDPGTLGGLWLSEKHDGVFSIRSCGDTICGALVGMQYDGPEIPRGKHGQSECGLTMLTDFRPGDDASGRWEGHILDPDSDKTYDAQIWSPRPNVMKLRGYVGIPLFGQTQTWTRYSGPIGAACKLPENP